MKKLALALISLVVFASMSFAASVTPTGMTQGALYRSLYNMQNAQLNCTIQSPAMAHAGAASANVSYSAFSLRNGGFVYALAASTNAVASGITATQSVTTALYLVESTSAGVLSAKGGTAVTPDPTAGKTPIAIVKVVKAATNTAGFKFGVTGLSSDTPSQTVTFINVGVMTSGARKISLTDI